jgi:diacylglycerol O-acyltransferase
VHVSTCYVNGFNRGDMREEPVHPAHRHACRHIEWDSRGFYDVGALLDTLQRKSAAVAANYLDADARRSALTELGIREAHRHGWNDTYTFTKWIGEQLALATLHGRSVTIVRPSIIESALQEPAPGWIEGVKVADAVILAYAHGKTRYFPGSADRTVDIVPVDLVVNAIVLATAEALQAPAVARIYQACTGSNNPITLGSVVDLIKDAAQRDWQLHKRLFARAPAHDFKLMSRPAFLAMLRLQRLGVGASERLGRALGRAVDTAAGDAVRTTEKLALTFSFYTAPRYRFHDAQLQGLAQRFQDADGAKFSVDGGRIDWRDYLCNIHLAGLNRYALRPRKAPTSATPAAPGQARQPARTRMTRRDFAWLRMDGARNLMVINSVLLFAGPLDMQRLKSTIAQRLPNYPRFTQVVRTRWGAPYWVEDEAFDIDAHVEHLPLAGVAKREALQTLATGMAHTPLATGRPLWHMSVIDGVEGGHAIIFRVHHCITDGLGLVHVLRHLTDDTDGHGAALPARCDHPHWSVGVRRRAHFAVEAALAWLKIGWHIGHIAALRPDTRTGLKRALGGDKALVWLPPIPLWQVHALARRMGTTINDVWVATVSGALRTYLLERGELADGGMLRAAVTFNLREKGNEFQLGNEFGLVAVSLPTDAATPLERLRCSSARMTAIKRSHQPHATMAFLSIAGALPRALQRLALDLFTSKGSVVLTNIEGPTATRYLAGARMTDVICWVPQAGLIGVGLALVSYAGQVQLALFVDRALVPEPQQLMALTRAAFDELDRATGGGQDAQQRRA